MNLKTTMATFALVALASGASFAQEPVDLTFLTRLREEAVARSQVMETLQVLCDSIGPRLTGSPQMKRANDWTRDTLARWGLQNAHLESWGPFGRGWSFEHVSVHMTQPQETPLIALPKAWTPGTPGLVRGKAVKVVIDDEADLGPWRGKLAGQIVFLGGAREVHGEDKPLLTRYSDKDLADLVQVPVVDQDDGHAARARRRSRERAIARFLAEEKPLAVVEPSPIGDGGTVFVSRGGSWRTGDAPGAPTLVMAVEHYNRVARLLDRKQTVELELDVRTTFHDDDPMAYNTIAEIPGVGPKPEVVMVGAHLDSWHAGTGATDNAAGVAVAMEAVRLLKALDVRPQRTIRIGLWSGEEQGLLGSRAYVAQHFGTRPVGADGKPGAFVPKPEHATLSVYLNLDSGTGRVRGVYTQGNVAARPIFQAWLEPLGDLGARTVSVRNDTGTDHESFDSAGLPGFDLMQDDVEYETRTHHSSMDVYDRLQREDLVQASIVMAAFAYDAAMRPGAFPRKPPAEAVELE